MYIGKRKMIMGKIDDLKRSIQDTSLQYIQARSKEYVDKQLSGRLVLEFHGGKISQIYDQPIIKGISQLAYYLDKIE